MFQPGAIAFYGPNGAGKTNLLEAISLLSPGRGLRRAKAGLLARVEEGTSCPAWGINAALHTQTEEEAPTRISIGQVPEFPRRRQLKIDGKTATGPELARRLSMLWLTPAQDGLFTGPAADRRKFIDRFALAFTPDHGANAVRFEKARSERNRLISDGITDRAWYEAIEADLSKFGALVAQARALTIQNLQIEIAARETIFPQSLIGLRGTLEDQFLTSQDIDSVARAYQTQLAQERQTDMRAGRTLTGPHRTEVHVTHKAKALSLIHI